MAANFIDLTVRGGPSAFSDDEDEEAFGNDRTYRKLYEELIWKLKHNDPNLGLLDLRRTGLSEEACVRIGVYLWSSKHVKNLVLESCDLTGSKMEHLFGKIAAQNEANDYVVKEDFLGKLVAHEETLVNGIMEGVTSFPHLLNVNVSLNRFGASGLDVLVRSLSGSPIKTLDLTSCGLKGIDPLRGLRKCKRLKNLDLGGNRVRMGDLEAVETLIDDGYPKLYKLSLQNCGIRNDMAEAISLVLPKNKSLRYLFLQNNICCDSSRSVTTGKHNHITERGIAALIKAINDSSSFDKTLASNHTIRKLVLDRGDPDDRLFAACHPNFSGRNPYTTAWVKYINNLVRSEFVDASGFMDLDVKHIPHLLAWVGREWNRDDGFWVARGWNRADGLCALYKIWSCRMFRDRIQTASQISNLEAQNNRLNAKVGELESAGAMEKERNEQLAAENERLRAQVATWMAQRETPGSRKHDHPAGNGSIAGRVKRRRNTGKLERKEVP